MRFASKCVGIAVWPPPGFAALFEHFGALVLVAKKFNFPRDRVLGQVLILRLRRCAQMSKHKTLELKTRAAEVEK